MRKVAIVQARLGSTRFPGKVLADLNGRPMLSWLLTRLKATSGLDAIVVATTGTREDDKLTDWLENEEPLVACFRGSQDDVLARFHGAAQAVGADLIVRITADDPLKDPRIISRLLAAFDDDADLDYFSNTIEPTYPEGLDVEVFTREALDRAHAEAVLASEREHVTPYIWKNSSIFRVRQLHYERNLSNWRWTVDKPADLHFMRIVFAHFANDALIDFERVIDFLEARPEVRAINSGTVRNEGYLKSLEEDRNV